jgi:alpha-mannosidase
VRQVLYGKRYFKQKFNVDVNIGWNPDSFGYNWQLPQIYKRSGIDYFVTQKLLWASEFTKFPYRLFWWQAPDGSRLMTYFPSTYSGQIDAVTMAQDSSVYGPLMWKYKGGTNSAPDGALQMMYLYGVGDHGGGPTRLDLDNAMRWQKPDVVFPKLELSTAASFLNELSKHESELNLPVWNGELYFQYHRGVQTTQSETKRGNRKSEVALLDAEKLASIGTLFGQAYPQADFDSAWKKVLFNQFHDILPGSGIAINYVDAARKYAEVQRFSNDTVQAGLHELAARVKTDDVGVLVFNPLPWTRTGTVEVEAQLPPGMTGFELVDADGSLVSADVVSSDATNRLRLRLLAKEVPATGYKVIRITSPGTTPAGRTHLQASATSLENRYVRVTVDPRTGCITSLVDKRTNTEALAPAVPGVGAPANLPDGKPCGNLLQAFVDKPEKWDAWNVDANFTEHHTDLMQAGEVKLVEHTSTRAVIRVTHKWQSSSFVQDITLDDEMPRVDVNMQADWHEKHILLKVAFPLSARNDKATFEIPYGTVERPTTRNTPAEKAQFEVPALRWADLSGTDSGTSSGAVHGFSLLNDSKYGYDARDNVLRLSLLRAPEYPDPNADQGHHEFTYSLYPHARTWREAQTVRQGYEVNVPLLAVTTTPHQGTLPPSQSFFSTQEDNVVITAIKKDADDTLLIIRFYEWAGKKGDVHLTLPQAAAAAWQTNLMEMAPSALGLDASGKIVAVPTNPYEIKTVKVQFANP